MPRKAREMPWCEIHRGTYHAHWYDAATHQTRRLSLRTADSGEAQSRFAAFLLSGQELTHGGLDGLTVATALDDYWNEHVEPHVIDKARAEDAIDNLRRHFGALRVADVSAQTIRQYLDIRRAGTIGKLDRGGRRILPASNGTLARELGVLAAALNHEVRERRLSRADVPEFKKPATPRSRNIWLFHDELERLRAAARSARWTTPSPRVGDFIELAYWTGARKHSIEALTIFQVNLERGLINLSPAGDVETKKRRGIVPIAPELRPTVERLVANAKATGTPHLLGDARLIDRSFLACARRAGLRDLPERDMRPAGHCSPHVLRHTRATHLLEAGADLHAVARLLCDTAATVDRVYGHHSAEYLERGLKGRGA